MEKNKSKQNKITISISGEDERTLKGIAPSEADDENAATDSETLRAIVSCAMSHSDLLLDYLRQTGEPLNLQSKDDRRQFVYALNPAKAERMRAKLQVQSKGCSVSFTEKNRLTFESDNATLSVREDFAEKLNMRLRLENMTITLVGRDKVVQRPSMNEVDDSLSHRDVKWILLSPAGEACNAD